VRWEYEQRNSILDSQLKGLHTLVVKCRSCDPRHTASTPLLHPEAVLHIAHHRVARQGCRSLFADTPCSMALSRVNSATSFFSFRLIQRLFDLTNLVGF
jgi:hypothetical protein